MPRTNFRRLIFILGVTSTIHAFAQDEIVPVGQLPTHYNAGFAGEAGRARVAVFSYMQFFQRQLGDYSNHFSYDNFFQKLHSGVSIQAGQFYSKWLPGNPVFEWQNSYAKVAVSPKLSFKGKYTFAPFVEVGIKNLGGVNIYADIPSQPDDKYRSTAVTVQSGFLFNTSKSYLGLSVTTYRSEFNKENYHPGSSYQNQFEIILQAGHTFQRRPDSKFSFTPQAVIKYHVWDVYSLPDRPRYYSIDFPDLSLLCRYKKVTGGLTTAGITVGYQNEDTRILLYTWPSNLFSLGVGFRHKFKSDNATPFSLK